MDMQNLSKKRTITNLNGIVHTFYVYNAIVLDVYDGDTFTAEVDLGFDTFRRMKFRLLGVDTPELRGEERPQGLIVRDLVRDMILNKQVVLKTLKDSQGKYGRYLSEVWIGDTNLSIFLLENGHATAY